MVSNITAPPKQSNTTGGLLLNLLCLLLKWPFCDPSRVAVPGGTSFCLLSVMTPPSVEIASGLCFSGDCACLSSWWQPNATVGPAAQRLMVLLTTGGCRAA